MKRFQFFISILVLVLVQAATANNWPKANRTPKVRILQNQQVTDKRLLRRKVAIQQGVTLKTSTAVAEKSFQGFKRKSHSGASPVLRSRKKTKVATSSNFSSFENAERWIVKFRNVSTEKDRSDLEKSLAKLTKDQIRLATRQDFKSKANPCLDGTCAILLENQIQDLKAKGFQFDLVALRSQRSFLKERLNVDHLQSKNFCGSTPNELKANRANKIECSGNPNGHTYKSGPAGGSSSPASIFGSSAISVWNSDPFVYYIPDYGYQELGDYFPNPSILGPTAFVTAVDYEVGVAHDYMSDLLIKVGYDDTAIGGSSNLETTIWNQFSDPDSYNILSGTTHAFDGYYPDSYYYVGAWDNVAQDIGYLDYVFFDVWFQADSDLKLYTGSGSDNGSTLLSNRYLDVNLSVQNDSTVNAGSFDVAWYLTPEPWGGCNNLSTFNTSTSFFIGYDTVSSLQGGWYVNTSLVNVDLAGITNTGGASPSTGHYCMWAKIDDLDEEFEYDETNNIAVYDPSLYFVSPPPPTPDLTVTAGNYSHNAFSNLMSVNAQFANNTNVPVTSQFSLGWYLSPMPVQGCSLTYVNTSTATAYFAGYNNFNGVAAYGFGNANLTNVNLQAVQNPQGQVLSAGNYCLWAYVDDLGQVNEGTGGGNNNYYVYGQPIQYAPIPPNLTFMSSASASLSNTYFLSVSNTILNDSVTSTSTSFQLSWYLTPTTSGCSAIVYNTSTAFFAGSRTFNGLAANTTGNQGISNVDLRTLQNSLNQNMAVGSYCLWAKVDSANSVAEGNENDNYFYTYSLNPIQYNLPNIVIQSGSSTQFTTSSTMLLNATAAIKNTSGIVPVVGDFAVNFFLTPDTGSCGTGTLNTGTAYAAGGAILNGMNANGTLVAQLNNANLNTILNPQNQALVNGSYCVWAYADGFSEIPETDEYDNVYAYLGLLQFERPELSVNPDSAVTNFVLNADETMDFAAQVTNSAALAQINNNFILKGYVAAKPTGASDCFGQNFTTANSWLAATYTFSSLAPNSNADALVSNVDLYSLTNGSGQHLSAGDYCVWYQVDTSNTITESNENNNKWVVQNPFTLTLQTGVGADLQPGEIPAIGQPAVPPTITGYLLTAVAGIANNGNAMATIATNAKWYLSSKPVSLGCDTLQNAGIPSNAWYLGQSTVNPLMVGFIAPVQVANVDIRFIQNSQGQTIPTGEYCVWIQADSDAQIHEGNENNNVLVLGTSVSYVNTVSVSEASEQQLQFYPNPATDHVLITMPDSLLNESVEIRLYAMNGQLVRREGFGPGTVVRFDLTGISAGQYVLQLQSKKGQLQTRLLKQ